MKKTTLSILFCIMIFNFALISPLMAQKDMKATLLKDVVKVENGSYSIEEYGLLNTFDRAYEVKIMATAPVRLMSRDNFLRFYGAFSSSIFSTYLSQEGVKAPDDLHILLKAKPGNPIDLDVAISMNEKGVDYKVVTKNSTSKMNIQWLSQLYLDIPK